MEAEGSTEQQHTLDKAWSKRHPDHADRELKRRKDSVSAGQHTINIDQAASAALLDVGFEKKTAIEESQGDKGDKKVIHPEDEQQLAAPICHHPEPPTELPHLFAESVEVQTAPVGTAEQELLLPPGPPPASKVYICKYNL